MGVFRRYPQRQKSFQTQDEIIYGENLFRGGHIGTVEFLFMPHLAIDTNRQYPG